MRVRHEITIRALRDDVWALTAAVDGWPAITPTVTSVELTGTGAAVVGFLRPLLRRTLRIENEGFKARAEAGAAAPAPPQPAPGPQPTTAA